MAVLGPEVTLGSVPGSMSGQASPEHGLKMGGGGHDLWTCLTHKGVERFRNVVISIRNVETSQWIYSILCLFFFYLYFVYMYF